MGMGKVASKNKTKRKVKAKRLRELRDEADFRGVSVPSALGKRSVTAITEAVEKVAAGEALPAQPPAGKRRKGGEADAAEAPAAAEAAKAPPSNRFRWAWRKKKPAARRKRAY